MHKVAVVGGGSWGTAFAALVAENIREKTSVFDKQIVLWAKAEVVDGEEIAHGINTGKRNKKYLPGVQLPENIHCTSSLQKAIKDADILIFAVPTKYLGQICADAAQYATNPAVALSLSKGFVPHDKTFCFPSETIKRYFPEAAVSALSGPNIALEIAHRFPAETTLASADDHALGLLSSLIQNSFLSVKPHKNITAVEAYGALKNIVAVGLGAASSTGCPSNTLAVILRKGITEMVLFLDLFCGIKDTSVFLEPCGIGDLFVTLLAGRSMELGRNIAKKKEAGAPEIQAEHTAADLHAFLAAKNKTDRFPFFTAVYNAVSGKTDPESFVSLVATPNPL
ncbi:MAG: glycerol-3-phosphate dehydrogenase [Amphiamblys sp. WSBS2006]|nr:MAG: glycerol-3-phosphate dehydrogenase [Amphiamblys sp. WSBS2006]